MKALEFQTRLNPDATLTVPAELAAQIRREQPVRVILLLPELDEDAEWAQMAAEQFLQGYAEGDSLYDDEASK
jgi:hypothetical protein